MIIFGRLRSDGAKIRVGDRADAVSVTATTDGSGRHVKADTSWPSSIVVSAAARFVIVVISGIGVIVGRVEILLMACIFPIMMNEQNDKSRFG